VAGARALVWAAGLLPHLGEPSGPNALPNLSKRSMSQPPTGTSCQPATEPWLDVFGLLIVEGFHGVACFIA
jgi:hypothetical protein